MVLPADVGVLGHVLQPPQLSPHRHAVRRTGNTAGQDWAGRSGHTPDTHTHTHVIVRSNAVINTALSHSHRQSSIHSVHSWGVERRGTLPHLMGRWSPMAGPGSLAPSRGWGLHRRSRAEWYCSYRPLPGPGARSGPAPTPPPPKLCCEGKGGSNGEKNNK